MRYAQAQELPRMKRSAAPRCEGLEDRCLLSGKPPMTVTFQETPGTSGTSDLVITDMVKNDSLSISDNGKGTAGNIFVSSGDGQEYMSTSGVVQIAVLTGRGTDRVTYELDGNMQPNVSQFVEVGSTKKGGGPVDFTVNVVGKVLDTADLTALAFPKNNKSTMMTVNDSGEIDGGFSAGIASFGPAMKSHAPEAFSFNSTATIGSSGDVSTGVIGSTKNDFGNVSYSGTNDGELDIFEEGNGGNDNFAANVYMAPGSTGTVGSSTDTSMVTASGKKDKLRFTIYQGTDSTTTTNIYAELIDHSKKDSSVHTANVMAVTKGLDMVVS